MVQIKAIADYVEGAGMHVIEVRRLGDEISRLQNYYISSDFPNFFAEKVINSLSTLHSTPYTGSSAAH